MNLRKTALSIAIVLSVIAAASIAAQSSEQRPAKQKPSTVREAFYKQRMEDNSLSFEIRIAYMDSLLALNPADYRIRMVKSDICSKIGRYSDAAEEYLRLYRNHSDALGTFNTLRAIKRAAETFTLANRPNEAAQMALELLHYPKPDSLRHYDLAAENIVISQALLAGDTTLTRKYLVRQKCEIDRLAAAGLMSKSDVKQFRGVREGNLVTLLTIEGRYDEALAAAKLAKAYAATHSDTIHTDISIANIYRRLGQFDVARTYFERFAGDESVYFNMRQQRTDYADVLFRLGDLTRALEIIDTPDPERINDYAEINRLTVKSSILSARGQWKEAFDCLSAAFMIDDSLSSGGDPYAIAVRDFELGNEKYRSEAAERHAAQWKTSTWIIAVLLIFALAAIALLVIRLRSQRNKTATLQRAVSGKDAEFSDIIEENSNKDRRLMASAMRLTNMAESISNIERLATEAPPDALSRISREIQGLGLTQNVWEIFRTSFERVNPGFFARLTADHPGLSNGEQRMAAYIVIGMNTKEIASIINRQPRSVETIKYRLRKHLGLSSDVSTDDYLRRYIL